MSTGIGLALVFGGLGCVLGSLVWYGWPVTIASLIGDALMTLGWAVQGYWASAAIMTVAGILALMGWWQRRKRRKRAPRAFGYKSRALIAAIVATLRERSQPRPVLRPQPGGASAGLATELAQQAAQKWFVDVQVAIDRAAGILLLRPEVAVTLAVNLDFDVPATFVPDKRDRAVIGRDYAGRWRIWGKRLLREVPGRDDSNGRRPLAFPHAAACPSLQAIQSLADVLAPAGTCCFLL